MYSLIPVCFSSSGHSRLSIGETAENNAHVPKCFQAWIWLVIHRLIINTELHGTLGTAEEDSI